MLSESLLRERLGELPIGIVTPAAPDSTNNVAKDLAKTDPEGPILVAADFQTGGRGRQGKSFASPPGGLYLSVLLPVGGRAASEIVGVTSASAVAVARSVDACAGCRTRIKWVNDVLLGDGKLAGILCEAVGETGFPRALVVGVGVNLCSAPKIPDAPFPPVSLADAGFRA
ncbi:MAG: biotin--[Clostridia bacterium]|nr:biotin--[acetyl-CoA-carboxylase] ligase [Clostridia bacterium]